MNNTQNGKSDQKPAESIDHLNLRVSDIIGLFGLAGKDDRMANHIIYISLRPKVTHLSRVLVPANHRSYN